MATIGARAPGAFVHVNELKETQEEHDNWPGNDCYDNRNNETVT